MALTRAVDSQFLFRLRHEAVLTDFRPKPDIRKFLRFRAVLYLVHELNKICRVVRGAVT